MFHKHRKMEYESSAIKKIRFWFLPSSHIKAVNYGYWIVSINHYTESMVGGYHRLTITTTTNPMTLGPASNLYQSMSVKFKLTIQLFEIKWIGRNLIETKWDSN